MVFWFMVVCFWVGLLCIFKGVYWEMGGVYEDFRGWEVRVGYGFGMREMWVWNVGLGFVDGENEGD